MKGHFWLQIGPQTMLPQQILVFQKLLQQKMEKLCNYFVLVLRMMSLNGLDQYGALKVT
jgi:hypothetical protein